MTKKTFYLMKNLAILIMISMIMLSYTYAQEIETPLITNVKVSPDQKQILIKADKPLGTHAAFAFQNPYRLVIDFENTGLGKVPLKVKIDKPPINEIRLGNNGHRARLVVDFGEYPVPPFMVERKGNLAVVALGEIPTDPRLIQRNSEVETNDKSHRSSVPQTQHRITSKPQPTHAPTPVPSAPPSVSLVAPSNKTEKQGLIVKQSLATNNLLLVELQDRKKPTEKYRIVMDFNLNQMTVNTVSLSNSNGMVKKFDLSESVKRVAQDNPSQENTSSSPVAIGPTKRTDSVAEREPINHPIYSWGSKDSTLTENDQTGQRLGNSNPFKLQRLELKSRNAGTARLDE
ncbi:MAG: AMIN domain-containing protein [Deltaproteobacteria bacterium]|nr:AMIN domain-containing protein [Deltaproteobacteria bacterium]